MICCIPSPSGRWYCITSAASESREGVWTAVTSLIGIQLMSMGLQS
jgi:hypothetical protein